MRQSRLITLLLTVMAVAAGSLAVASPASAAPLGLLRNYGNGLCIQPEGNSGAEGAPIVQVPCDRFTTGSHNPFQEWSALPQDPSGGVFYVQNHGSGFCLEVDSRANGAEIRQWECNWISNVDWSAGTTPVPGTLVLESRISGSRGFCLDVPGASGEVGLHMQLYRCNQSEAQIWQPFRD
jgi:Ricin-type beta-trefoil lectin domain